jgi:para-nitrobenzyl esterase
MASAASRDRRSAARIVSRACLLGAGLIVSLLVASATRAAEPTKPGDAAPTSAPKRAGEPVKIDTGLVQGVAANEAGTVIVFRGIPYAAPPLGELRWRPPQPAKAWEGVRECAKFGDAAPQVVSPLLNSFPGMSLGAKTNEDCLYLNVWTPARRPAEKLPVMVWVHGGGYIFGSDSQPLYEATNLSRRGVIVVGMNYRLGALGFLAHPALSAESEKGVSGNYGLLDQVEALRWVQRNIAAFGGDPQRVTVFGESAGGNAVYSLLLTPLAKGLFQRAIPESGSTLNFAQLKKSAYGRQPAEEQGIEFAKKCGVKEGPGQLADLRALPVDLLLNSAPGLESTRDVNFRATGMRLAPIVDGYVIPDDPMTMFQQGTANAVPLMVGANGNEGSMFTLVSKLPANAEAFEALLNRDFGPKFAATFKELYPPRQAKKSVTDLMGDFMFVDSARFVARNWEHTRAPAYLYNFSHVAGGALGKMLGAHHGSELAFVFDNLQLGKEQSPADINVRDTMIGYWIQFAATGNPNGNGLPQWPAYNATDDRCLVITDGCEAVPNFRKAKLDAIDAVMEAWRNAGPNLEPPQSTPEAKPHAATEGRAPKVDPGGGALIDNRRTAGPR